MKTSTILATCALALLNTQTCLASLLNDTASIPDRFHLEDTPSIQSITSLSGEPVPFKICESFDNATAGFIVNEISLSPNPPVRGQDLDIIIKGDLHKQMAKGALVRVVVWKFGMAFAILEFDWCANVKGLTCPIEPGNVTFSILQNIERGIPPWTYLLSVEIYNQAGEEMSCLQVETKVAKKPKKKELKDTLVDVGEEDDPE